MLKRTITAVVAIALFIPICIYSDTVIFPLAMAILSLIGVNEMLGCVGARGNLFLAISSLILGALMPMIPFFTDEYTIDIIMALSVAYLICVYSAAVFSRGKLDYTVSASAFMGVFYIAVSFTSIVLLREEGRYLYLLTFIGPWVSDTFAYFCGRLFGKHKLIPEISPKKTVEGSIGGIIFASVAFVVYSLVIVNFFDTSAEPNLLILAVSGAVVSVISQIGDLSASAVKRKFGVKDYGFVFPGHGGVMDRFDSVIMTAPVLYILSQLPFFNGMMI